MNNDNCYHTENVYHSTNGVDSVHDFVSDSEYIEYIQKHFDN